MSANNETILVAGVGNIFLGDDAFGVEVADRMRSRPALPGVYITEFGIRSYDLAYTLMEPWELVILVDALPRGGTPGTVYILEVELPKADPDAAQPAVEVDPHSMNPAAVLQLVAQLGGQLDRLLVVGCEPSGTEADEEGNIGLSQPVEAAVGETIDVIDRLIAAHRRSIAA